MCSHNPPVSNSFLSYFLSKGLVDSNCDILFRPVSLTDLGRYPDVIIFIRIRSLVLTLDVDYYYRWWEGSVLTSGIVAAFTDILLWSSDCTMGLIDRGWNNLRITLMEWGD